MIKLLRWMAAAFSMYSRIPMPRFTWHEEDAAGGLSFLPLVGAVIGTLSFALNVLPWMEILPQSVRILGTILIPILVTGGFHLDGYMDTEDALRSYGSCEKKLEILKDPHVGAFAVIGLIRVLLLFAAAVTMLFLYRGMDARPAGCFAGIFVLGRCLCAFTSLFMKKARKEGMLYEETKGQDPLILRILVAETAACLLFIFFVDPVRGGILCLVFALCILFYVKRIAVQFGGVTGDTAGYFLTVSETAAALALALSVLLPV